ncbi:hypothetical protein K504DRAFT_501130 [Pleomassaria siparia CBS 279.74]|uniref:Uncharacterized protein n=1 Tax=Pleomassaria siparia CBS 279.74 TaxID=1314801 RepID=A0A6G1KF07_9PLEO|nr:hypothetical protein K504DRAFT_501130 [Pleomassaria siparia CBS 279.74]
MPRIQAQTHNPNHNHIHIHSQNQTIFHQRTASCPPSEIKTPSVFRYTLILLKARPSATDLSVISSHTPFSNYLRYLRFNVSARGTTTMFCLRSWIPILFFLLRTNASPVYLVLFISATYFLNRPCVYCSLLLFILVVALFDFHTPWFESPLSAGSAGPVEAAINGTSPLADTVFEKAGILVSAANSTARAMIKAAVDGVKGKFTEEEQGSAAAGASYEWVSGLKEWRIPCLDVLVRI